MLLRCEIIWKLQLFLVWIDSLEKRVRKVVENLVKTGFSCLNCMNFYFALAVSFLVFNIHEKYFGFQIQQEKKSNCPAFNMTSDHVEYFSFQKDIFGTPEQPKHVEIIEI